MKQRLCFWLLAALPWSAASAQSAPPTTITAEPLALSLREAVDYALKNKPTLLATRLGEQTASAKVGEIRSLGLPQVNAGLNVADNFKQQKALVSFPLSQTVLTSENINSAETGKEVVLGTRQLQLPPQPFTFGQQWQGAANVSVSQLLFDGSYFLGLKAAKVYEELSRKQTQQAEIEVVEQVSKAYYSTLVARERLQLLARNVQRLDTLLQQTSKTFKEGFVEKLDVDRLRVQRNNLVVEQQKAQRLTELSVALLKFQMGLPQQQGIELTDALNTAVVDAGAMRQRLGVASFGQGGGSAGAPTAPATAPGQPDAGAQAREDRQTALTNGQTTAAGALLNYNNRIEFSTLETQQALAGLDLRNRRVSAFPRLLLTGAYGFNGAGPTAGDLFEFRGAGSRAANGFPNQNWFGFGNVGLTLQVPVFDGFRRSYQVQQARIQQQTIEKGFETLRQSIDLQDASSRTTLINALDVLENQQANLKLAEDIARVSKIKFQEGVGSNLEVVAAETDLRAAQTNYYAAVYDVLVAKVDRDKATGELASQAKK